MKKGVVFVILILLISSLSNLLLARSRSEVIKDAYDYVNLTWTVGVNNILDVETHVAGSTETQTAGSDGIDDRSFKRDIKTGVWIYSLSNWPYSVGQSVTGEAYGYGIVSLI